MKKSKCDIIIPVWNQMDFTKRCIDALRASTRYPYRIIIIDNSSNKETADYLKDIAARDNDIVTLIRNEENLGFIKATNQGLKVSDSRYICFLNNDTVPTDSWLTKMVLLAESDAYIGLVNPRSEFPGKLSFEEYSKKLSLDKGKYIETNQCMGFCMLIKREIIDKIGFLDEVYGLGGFDDTDFSKRAHLAGYKCVCSKEAYVYHDWHTSFAKAGNRETLVKKNEKIFFDRWGKFLRIGYPIVYSRQNGFYNDISVSLGLAREWNWVHAWLNDGGPMRKELNVMRLPEHQSLRMFSMSGIKCIFYLEVLFKLIERRLKGRKLFDVIIVTDRGLGIFLSFFRKLFNFPVFYIEKNKFADRKKGDDELLWRSAAREIVDYVSRGENK